MYELNQARTIRRGIIIRKVLYNLEKNQTRILISLVALCFIILSLSIISTKVTAQKAIPSEKLVTSVKIEKGDTLWSIANQYITDEYDDINTYIKEIKKTNRLTSDTIHEGCYIVVPYYATYE